MSSVIQNVQKIAAVRALKLGDFLVATPAFRALRHAFPKAQIDYVGLPWAQSIMERYNHYFSNFIPFPGLPGLPEQAWTPQAVTEFLRHMHDQKYDLVLQLHGNGTLINPFIALCGERSAGFACQQSFWPNTELFMEYPETEPEVWRPLKLLGLLGIAHQGTQLEFPVQVADIQELPPLPASYVCLHPGAISSKKWPAAHFAAVGDWCASQGLDVVLTGTEPERPIAQAVASRMKSPVIDLAGKTSLGAVGALIKRSQLFIGNDTGTAHIAVATNTPSVTIFSTSDPKRWAPLDSTLHPIVLPSEAAPERVIKIIRTLITKGKF